MRSTALLLGIFAFFITTLAQAVSTVKTTDILTITSCSSGITNCPAATSPVYPPTSVSLTTTPIPTTLSSYPLLNITTITAPSNLSSSATTSTTTIPSNTSATASPSFTNSTLTVGSITPSGGLATASGSPSQSTITSMVVVNPSATVGVSAGGSATSSSAKASGGSNAGERLALPGVSLGLVAMVACLLG